MKKTIIITSFIILGFIFTIGHVQADWWTRPTARPTQPSIDRDIPTSAPQPTSQPTQAPADPTATPSGGGQGGVPTTAPSEQDDDPCAPGKDYYGPHCGWSPGVGEASSDSEGETTDWGLTYDQPQVLGLSATSSNKNMSIFDIMQLIGVLCLALYAKSKLKPEKSLLKKS